MKEGFLSIAKFARKIGASDAAIYNWIALNAIPFQVDPITNAKIIPEFDAMESPRVKAFLSRGRGGRVVTSFQLTETPKSPTAVTVIPVASQQKSDREEELFMIARQQAAGFIARARNCRADGRHEAEAELLWMAAECFGFKP